MLSSDARPIEFTRALAEESVQRKAVEYDRSGDAHYDAISALIKSMRGSDPDAAIYWLARLLEAGEDIRFLARRVVIFASEDVGNADPHALPLAIATMQACEFIGLPECQLNLAQAVTYLACGAQVERRHRGHRRSRARRPRGPAGAGAGHAARQPLRGGQAARSRPGLSIFPRQPRRHLRPRLPGCRAEYYRPVDRGAERELAERLKIIRAKLREGRQPPAPTDA